MIHCRLRCIPLLLILLTHHWLKYTVDLDIADWDTVSTWVTFVARDTPVAEIHHLLHHNILLPKVYCWLGNTTDWGTPQTHAKMGASRTMIHCWPGYRPLIYLHITNRPLTGIHWWPGYRRLGRSDLRYSVDQDTQETEMHHLLHHHKSLTEVSYWLR